ncbi:N-acetylglucosamine-6-sulfatase-like [Tubulanus polymorphus]|uniref:N-acetylglucosamine-6-sulfatase-like n=1 Tax=Tubulanus polymorphus TaxID=672921 RepID=UPI003DA47433
MYSNLLTIFLIYVVLVREYSICIKPPNVVFILTDDQDVVMDGMEPMVKVKKYLMNEGVTFKNMFVSSPLCCPSRSAILTGRYIHNIPVFNNSIKGNCNGESWRQEAEKSAFITHLKNQGYRTMFAGKYLNQYGKKKGGGVKHVPPGWDSWIGLVGNSAYYNYVLSVNGTAEKHGSIYSSDYLTDLISKKAQDFLDYQTHDGAPFFMMLSTPACHAPFTSAPQYSHRFNTSKSPRQPNFNIHAKDKHWLIRTAKNPMSQTSIEYLDDTFRNRWKTLLSVDDLVESVVKTLEAKKLLDNTYIFFSSDNGFHLGQYSLPTDKRQLYEFDIRVPLIVRGPGIKPNTEIQDPVMSIDLAPTFLDLGFFPPPSYMDGKSFLPLLVNNRQTNLPPQHRDMLIEYFGEHKIKIKGCPWLNNRGVAICFPDCVCEDAWNNTYSCLRFINLTENYVFCEFLNEPNFYEYYNMKFDPYQLQNSVNTLDPRTKTDYLMRLQKLKHCKGESCRAA